MEKRVQAAPGLSLACLDAGEGDPPLVFVHGWACDRTYLAPQTASFAKRHRVLAPDMRGHGASDRAAPAPGAYAVGTLADDVLAAVAALGANGPVVVGHSLGALVALACAARSPDVRAVVLLDPAPLLPGPVKDMFARSVPDVAADADGAWRAAFAQRLFRPTDTVRRAETVARLAGQDPAVAAAVWAAIGAFDGAAALAAVRAPMLLVAAGRPEPGLREACRGLTVGRTVGAGHFLPLEVPEQVNAMIARFLAVNGLAPAGRDSGEPLF